MIIRRMPNRIPRTRNPRTRAKRHRPDRAETNERRSHRADNIVSWQRIALGNTPSLTIVIHYNQPDRSEPRHESEQPLHDLGAARVQRPQCSPHFRWTGIAPAWHRKDFWL